MKKILFLIPALALMMASCQPKVTESPVKHVFLIGLDGLSAKTFAEADMPFTRSLMEQGSYTLKKRSVLPSSSAINWASMFMAAPTEIHGYTQWGSKVPELPSREVTAHGMFPTVFSVLRDHEPEAQIDVLYDWDGIKYLVDTLSLSHYAQANTDDIQVLTRMAVEDITANRPRLAAYCYDHPDHEGHGEGWGTDVYMSMLTELDGCIRQIVEAIQKAGILEESVIIVTGDHGGINKGHGSISLNEMETPFIITGPGIRKNFCFDSWSMMQYDVAATMADILGFEMPQVCTGRSVKVLFE